MDSIHGLTFIDYAATNAFLAQGRAIEELLPTLGVELPQWEEASQHFEKAMANDDTYKLAMKLGEVFKDPAQGKFAAGGNAPVSAETKIVDLDQYIDVQSLMQAASDVGIDPQAMLAERGLTVMDFSQAGMRFQEDLHRRLADESPEGSRFRDDFTRKTNEGVAKYSAMFREITGGGVADDIEF